VIRGTKIVSFWQTAQVFVIFGDCFALHTAGPTLFDIEKIAKSIVGFSDYFSLRILLLLLSCFFVYHYTWSDQYYVVASKIHSDLLAAIDAFANDKVLALFKLEVIVPFLFFFLLISLLDIHMRVLGFISDLFPFYVTVSYTGGSYAIMQNEEAIFRQWRNVSGAYDRHKYRDMVISDFFTSFTPPQYTHGTLLSLISYLKAYGLILFFGAIVTALWRCDLARSPPAVERRRIAHPKAQDYANLQGGITAGICGRRNGDGLLFCVATILRTEYPLWVKSGHCVVPDQCPLYPQKQTLELSRGPLCANSRHYAAQQNSGYSTTSSASNCN
jgi:hypothetical protein